MLVHIEVKHCVYILYLPILIIIRKITGDSGYALQPWLMTPIRHAANQQEEAYNKSHQLARHRVERCIGLLKSRFRCLSRQRIVMYSPAKAGAIINSCAVLHNIMVEQKYPEIFDDGVCDIEEISENNVHQMEGNVR